ncbi:DUF58 domain-containing protein [Amphibacillus sp. Q70]|uniref:DUF58 domain-containing protein n=1 Tax=Amphibacillus sp. Q70 TaxID=3453416 RepID=UPI003F83D8E3
MTSLRRLWARFLFQDRGIVPTKRLIYLVLACGTVLFAMSFYRFDLIIYSGVALLIILLSLFDLPLSPRRSQLKLARIMPEDIERHQQDEIQLTIINESEKAAQFHWTDDLPRSIQTERQAAVDLLANQSVTLVQPIQASERGLYPLKKVYLRYRSWLGLWEKQVTFDMDDTLKVIPNLTEARDYLQSAQKYLLHEGVKIRRQKTGLGEFSKVRQYAVGDDPRKINWHQSAKLHQMMVNEYEPEHGKQVILMIDCGRMMGVELNKGNRLERSIEAALTVATAALDNGDYVSVVAFAKEIKVYVPPDKGLAHLQTILQAIYSLSVESSESNYLSAFQFIQTEQRKRSMVLLFSDINQFFLDSQSLLLIKQIRKKHLFLGIGITDQWKQKNIERSATTLNEAMRKTVAQQMELWNRRERIKWKNLGLDLIEAKEEDLAVTTVSYYIDQLNRGML